MGSQPLGEEVEDAIGIFVGEIVARSIDKDDNFAIGTVFFVGVDGIRARREEMSDLDILAGSMCDELDTVKARR